MRRQNLKQMMNLILKLLSQGLWQNQNHEKRLMRIVQVNPKVTAMWRGEDEDPRYLAVQMKTEAQAIRYFYFRHSENAM